MTDETSRVSVDSAGEQGDEASTSPAISADGQYVAFVSYATNLGEGEDTNGVLDVYVRDRSANETSRVSVGQGNSEANGESLAPSISAHGRFVAFHSFASNLVAADTNGAFDVFVRNLATNQTSRESVGPDGRQVHFYESRFPDISAHGRYVAFESRGARLVSGDTNQAQDIFVRDRLANVTSRVSVGQHETRANAGGPASRTPRNSSGLRNHILRRHVKLVLRTGGSRARSGAASSGRGRNQGGLRDDCRATFWRA